MNTAVSTSLKSFLHKTAPRPYGALQSIWRHYLMRRFDRRLERITRSIVRRYGWRVLGGPFAGMEYGQEAIDSALIPKLLGCYEAELHGVLAHAMEAGYAGIINVGCAEGYYAVGLALRLPGTCVWAFDSDARARELCAKMAAANGVSDRVIVAGACDIERLGTLSLARTLLICDVDGYELELLRPAAVSALVACDILVELHDYLDPSITPTILARFALTHDIELFESVERDPAAYSALDFLRWPDRKLALDELRPPQRWAFMRATRT